MQWNAKIKIYYKNVTKIVKKQPLLKFAAKSTELKLK